MNTDGDPQLRPARPMPTALIDEDHCIGCTLCIQACPVDAIVGAARRMHTVVEALCIGCERCIPPCPVDCISMVPATPPRIWTRGQARAAHERLSTRLTRLEREQQARDQRLASRTRPDDPADVVLDASPSGIDRIAAIVSRAVLRARQRRSRAAR